MNLTNMIPFGKIAATILLASTMGMTSIAPAAANNVGEDILHTIECARLLISNPTRHLAECGVGDYDPGRLQSEQGGNPRIHPEVGPDEGSPCEFGLEGEIGVIVDGQCTINT